MLRDGSDGASFIRRRDRDDAFLAVDRHGRVQCGRAAAEALKTLVRIRTLHQSGLKQH